MTEMITIERSLYDRMREALEDQEDRAIIEHARNNPEEGIPSDVMGRLLADENPVLVYREWRGLAQAELARRAGLHRAQVHDIENGKRRGSVDTLKKIAQALDVSLDLIV